MIDGWFWSRVEAEPNTGCLLWMGMRHVGNYGRVRLNGRLELAHRVAYQLVVGPIPAGLNVLHRCDNPPCCNPAHLFVGTQLDNVRDRDLKGRQAHGERSGAARLTAEQVRAIRERYAREPVGAHALAREYGVHPSVISCLVSGKTWRREGPPVQSVVSKRACGERHGMAKLRVADVEEIRRRYALGGITQAALGREFGVSQPTVGEIVRGEKWRIA